MASHKVPMSYSLKLVNVTLYCKKTLYPLLSQIKDEKITLDNLGGPKIIIRVFLL